MKKLIHKASNLYDVNKKYFPILGFMSGVTFDFITLNRIDNKIIIIQQFIYLVLTGILLYWLYTKSNSNNFKWKNHIIFLYHFLVGSLLSAFTIFYFKSSSFFASFGFILIFVLLLIGNELTEFKKKGIGFKIGIYSLCIVSYFSYVIPVIIGKIGAPIFLLSMLASILAFGLYIFCFYKFFSLEKIQIFEFLKPFLFVVLTFSGFYFAKWIPPVPLSVQHIGIYHNVEKQADGKYKLTFTRSKWKFWQNGDQTFKALPQDKIFVFFRLFAPFEFSEKIKVIWLYKNPNNSQWMVSDKIPVQIVGGRENGFRGYATKTSFEFSDDWKVSLQTESGQEISRIYFNIDREVSLPVELKYEYH